MPSSTKHPDKRSPMQQPSTPSFTGLSAVSPRASAAARGASRKTDTRCELTLRRELWRRGLRYRLHPPELPGQPDIAFRAQRVAVFCDGDFWHGRHLEARLPKLAAGHNATYWTGKLLRNVERDREIDRELQAHGWLVVRLWETDILKAPATAASIVVTALHSRADRAR